MRTLAAVLTLASGCAPDTPWWDDAGRRWDVGLLDEAMCSEIADDLVRIRIEATYDRWPGSIDDEAYLAASLDVRRSLFDGSPHEIRGSIDLPTDFDSFWDDLASDAIVFTAEPGHDVAIVRAVAVPYTSWERPRAGRFHVTGTLHAHDPCPTGALRIRSEDAIGAPVEAYMPLEPRP